MTIDLSATHSQAEILWQQGDLVAAHDLYAGILRIDPSDGTAHQAIAMLLYLRGDHASALHAMEHCVSLMPDDAVLLQNLGMMQAASGDTERAAQSWRQALRLQPGYTVAAYNLATLLSSAGAPAEAADIVAEVLRVNPDQADCWKMLGDLRRKSLDLHGALTAYLRALDLCSDWNDLYNEIGQIYLHLGQAEQARVALLTAHRLGCIDSAHLSALGTAHSILGDDEAACMALQEAVALNPADVQAHLNLAHTLQQRGDGTGALHAFAVAVQADATNPAALAGLLYQQAMLCDWRDFAARRELLAALLTDHTMASGAVLPFVIVALLDDPALQQRVARAYAHLRTDAFVRLQGPLRREVPPCSDLIRIGYLSGDFKNHPVAELIVEVLELHDRTRFEVVGYALDQSDGSLLRQRLVHACTRFIEVGALPSAAIAQRIADDGIDILIDLGGYTAGARSEVLALRPAPIQVNYLGYPGTMGAAYIDYILADSTIIPQGAEQYFDEKVLRLPVCYQPNDRKRATGTHIPHREALGLPDHAFVLCCFHQPFKITPEIFTVWMHILQAIPHALLWLLDTSSHATANLRKEAECQGIDAARLVFAPKMASDRHRARYYLADLFLDTPVYNAHTTASEALWCGLPVLTCIGNSFAARVCASLLNTLGLNDLVTTSLSQYEERALLLATQPMLLTQLRQHLHRSSLTAPLFDTPRYVHNLEDLYLHMTRWEISMEPLPVAVQKQDETALSFQ